MSALLAPLLSLLASLPGTLGDYFKGKREVEQLKIETQKQIELERQKLAATIAQADFENARDARNSTSSVFKYVAFGIWFGPYMAGLISSKLSVMIFGNLALMPEWYVQSVVLIMFTIWGISASSPVVVSIFNNLQSYFNEKRQYKLEVKKLSIDKKSFYEGMRAAKGMVSQNDVKKFDKIIDDLNK